jgi:preprotein translocase SecE subunit
MNPVEAIKRPVTRSFEFLDQCWQELKKVHFPSGKETRAATIVVIIGVVIVAFYLGLVDKILSWGIEKILTVHDRNLG